VEISLPSLSARYQPGADASSGSPSGGSIFTTRAPRRSSSRDANGPGRYRVRSTTVMPVRGGILPPELSWWNEERLQPRIRPPRARARPRRLAHALDAGRERDRRDFDRRQRLRHPGRRADLSLPLPPWIRGVAGRPRGGAGAADAV